MLAVVAFVGTAAAGTALLPTRDEVADARDGLALLRSELDEAAADAQQGLAQLRAQLAEAEANAQHWREEAGRLSCQLSGVGPTGGACL